MSDVKKDEDDFQTDHLEAMAEEVVDLTSEPDELAAIAEERDLLKDRLMRALADAENTRKRGERDRREAEKYGGAKFAKDMMSVYDNLKRAVDAIDPEKQDGAKAVIIESITPEIGEKFDPQLHQAMFEAPVPDTKAGDIIEVMTEGFMIHDRLLRPAQVGVSSTPG